jgi:hypothetical protein
MKFNDANNLNQQNNINYNNQNPIPNNLSKKDFDERDSIGEEKEDEVEETDNLKYEGFIQKDPSTFIKPRFDSTNSQLDIQYKFSIDMPNVSKTRLNEYLNNDLLNALDQSPSISKINSGIPENVQNINNNGDNNPNNLYGFSLYSQTNNQNFGNKNPNLQNPNMNNQNNFNYNYPNNTNNNNINYKNYNNNYIKLNYNQNIFIPAKYRNNEQYKKLLQNHMNNQMNNQINNQINNQMNNQMNNQINNQMNNQMNNQINNNKKETQKSNKNKFDNSKKNKQKGKKFFEVREGDWKCSHCNNLNFSFRNKCNRCNLSKELSTSPEIINQETYNQNLQQFQMMSGMNPNFIPGNINKGSNGNYYA